MRDSKIEGARIAQIVAEHARHYENCILCKRKTKNRGVFFPNESGTHGAAQGKYRIQIYALCCAHPQNDETLILVEKYLQDNTGTDLTKQAFGDLQ